MKLLKNIKCTIIDIGYVYSTYRDWIEENFSWALQKYRFIEFTGPDISKEYVIIGSTLPNEMYGTIYLIVDEESRQLYIIGKRGLKF